MIDLSMEANFTNSNVTPGGRKRHVVIFSVYYMVRLNNSLYGRTKISIVNNKARGKVSILYIKAE